MSKRGTHWVAPRSGGYAGMSPNDSRRASDWPDNRSSGPRRIAVPKGRGGAAKKESSKNG